MNSFLEKKEEFEDKLHLVATDKSTKKSMLAQEADYELGPDSYMLENEHYDKALKEVGNSNKRT